MSSHSNRRNQSFWGSFAALGAVSVAASWFSSAAPLQRGEPRNPRAKQMIAPGQRPNLGLLRNDPRTKVVAQKAGTINTLATPAPSGATTPPPQWQNLTTNPRPPLPGDSTRSWDKQPNWTSDGRNIFFASNRSEPDGLQATSGSNRFHIWLTSADGAVRPQQITGTGNSPADELAGDQEAPRLSRQQTKLAYLHRPNRGVPFDLYYLNRATNVRERLTGPNQFEDVGRADWSEDETNLTFAGRVNGRYNVYVVNVVTKVISQVTTTPPGSTVDFVDPAYVPNQNLISFASNGTSAPAGGGNVTIAGAARADFDLFTTTANAGVYRQLTSGPEDDRDPSWNFNPGEHRNALAFASRNRTLGGYTNVNTYDVFWASGLGGANVTLGQLHRITTPDNDPALQTRQAGLTPVIPDTTDERAPSWSPRLNVVNNGFGTSDVVRVVFHSNRAQQRVFSGNSPVTDPDTGLQALVYPVSPNNPDDIWYSDILDFHAPAVEPLDEIRSEIMSIRQDAGQGTGPHTASGLLTGPRLGSPGQRFWFSAKVRDRQSGVGNGLNNPNDTAAAVWVQIKDPDSAQQDAEGKEHKLFGEVRSSITWKNDGNLPTEGPESAIQQFLEYDCEGVSVQSSGSTMRHFRGPVRRTFMPGGSSASGDPRGAMNLLRTVQGLEIQVASYVPGIDDADAWSGNSFPPSTSNFGGGSDHNWLRLYDDGPVTQGGHEPVFIPNVTDANGQPVPSRANDAVYGNSWITPTVRSDYYVDLIVYDRAENLAGDLAPNWKIYDNIWGFSTANPTATNPVLAVMDYTLGQKFLQPLRGLNRRIFPQLTLGTESAVLDRTSALQPRMLLFPGDPASRYNLDQWTLLPFITLSPLFLSPQAVFGGAPGGYNYDYDIWRTLARGAVPRSYLMAYLPEIERQPADAANLGAPVARKIHSSMVFWSTPFAGDAWMGPGTLLDDATQLLLTDFVAAGGNLWVSGSDIARTLSGEGANPNQTFLRKVLGAQFVSDSNNEIIPASGGAFSAVRNDPATGIAGPPQISAARWLPQDFRGPGANALRQLVSDAVPSNEFHDQIAPDTTVGSAFLYDNTMVGRNTTAGGRLFFSGSGFEAVGQAVFFSPPNNPPDDLGYWGYRTQLAHNLACGLFGTTQTGRVTIQSGNALGGAFVQAIQGGQVVGTTFTDTDGRYRLRGMKGGNWSINVFLPGFNAYIGADRGEGRGAHGLGITTQDVVLTPAQPGSISGTMLDQNGNPVANARVEATLQAPEQFQGNRNFAAVTDAQGRYRITDLPNATYIVSVPTDSEGFVLNADGSRNPKFKNPKPSGAWVNPNNTVVVNVGQDTPNIDWRVGALPNSLTVQVYQGDADGNPVLDGMGNQIPLAGAKVTLSDPTTGELVEDPNGNTEFLTDANGRVVFALDVMADFVKPGDYIVRVSKDGYRRQSKVVEVPQTDVVEFVMKESTSAGTLRGAIKRSIGGVPLNHRQFPNLQIELWTFGEPINELVETTTLVAGETTPNVWNYEFTNIPDFDYQIIVKDNVHFANSPHTAGPVTVMPNTTAFLDAEMVGKPGSLSGTIREANTGTPGNPISGATVQVVRQSDQQVVATVTTSLSGRFQAPGLPSDIYTLRVSKFSFKTKDFTDIYVAGPTDTDLFMSLLIEPDSGVRLRGLVKREVDGQPLDATRFNDLIVELWNSNGTTRLLQTRLTAVQNGTPSYNYEFTNVPTGDYKVQVNDSRFVPFSVNTSVGVTDKTGVDILLTGLPGVLSGEVRGQRPNGSDAGPIAGARVRIFDQVAGGNTPVLTLTADANGRYTSTSALPSSLYRIEGSAFGYVTGSVVNQFVAGNTTADTLVLAPVPPQSISGTIRSSLDNSIIEGATVELLAQDGTVLDTVTSGPLVSGPTPYNYVFQNVGVGTYQVRVSKAAYRSSTQTVSVSPTGPSTGVNFVLTPSQVLPAGTWLVSAPYDYPNTDAAAVFGLSSAEFRGAKWLPSQEDYVLYPNAPANRLRLGQGMWIKTTRPTAITTVGATAPSGDFPIPLEAGWNMIGDPREFAVNWLDVKVRMADGVTVKTMQQAMNDGNIANGLYGWNGSSYVISQRLDPYKGYFVKAFQNVTLLVPNTAAASLVLPQQAPVAAGLHQQLQAELSAAGLAPQANVAEGLIRVTEQPRFQVPVQRATMPHGTRPALLEYALLSDFGRRGLR